jgi:hypothetical protein
MGGVDRPFSRAAVTGTLFAQLDFCSQVLPLLPSWGEGLRKFYSPGCLVRREAYTCWSTASGARVNNYGTRIDLILAAGPATPGAAGGNAADFHALFTGADIWADAQGSDHAPVWAELAPRARVPSADVPPPLASRYHFSGAQPWQELFCAAMGADSSGRCCLVHVCIRAFVGQGHGSF